MVYVSQCQHWQTGQPDMSQDTDSNSTSRPWYRRRRFLQMVSVAGAAGVAGCAGGGDSTPTPTADQNTASNKNTATPSKGKLGGELVAGTQADVVKLDPHLASAYSSFQVLENVYQKLTALNADLKPEGQLAKSWSVSDDGLTWTFELRQGVQFHPPVSRELKAKDVVYSIERIMDPETGSPRKSNFDPVKAVKADGDYTVVFEFDEPYAPFLYKLTTGYVMPEGAAESSEYDISKQPVGTGPFRFEEHQSQSHTLIKKFGKYWEKDGKGNRLPYLDAVRFKPIPEGSSRVTNLKTGSLDWIDTAPRSQASSLEKNESVHFSNLPGTWYDYIGHNLNTEPMGDKKLRQAISWAIDRPSIVKGARFGYGEPTQNPVPPASAWKEHIKVENPYSQNKEKAKQLLKESNYDGQKIQIMVGQQYKGQVNEAEIVQEQLSGIGINVEVAPTEWGTMVSKLNSGDFQMTIVGWIGFVDPDAMFYPLFHTGEKWNQTGYSNSKVDELLEKGRTATGDMKKRAEYYDKADDIIARDAPYTFLHFNDELMAWKPYVKGFTHYATGTVRFKTTWKDN